MAVVMGEWEAPYTYVEGLRKLFEGIMGDTKSSNPKDILAQGEERVLLHLVPSPALIETAKAMMDGARKYGAYNWREEGVGAATYVSAAMRHLRAWLDGEENASDSGVHHLGHAMACMAIILDAIAVGNLVDDRPLPAPTAQLLDEVKKQKSVKIDAIDAVPADYPFSTRTPDIAAEDIFVDEDWPFSYVDGRRDETGLMQPAPPEHDKWTEASRENYYRMQPAPDTRKMKVGGFVEATRRNYAEAYLPGCNCNRCTREAKRRSSWSAGMSEAAWRARMPNPNGGSC